MGRPQKERPHPLHFLRSPPFFRQPSKKIPPPPPLAQQSTEKYPPPDRIDLVCETCLLFPRSSFPPSSFAWHQPPPSETPPLLFQASEHKGRESSSASLSFLARLFFLPAVSITPFRNRCELELTNRSRPFLARLLLWAHVSCPPTYRFLRLARIGRIFSSFSTLLPLSLFLSPADNCQRKPFSHSSTPSRPHVVLSFHSPSPPETPPVRSCCTPSEFGGAPPFL